MNTANAASQYSKLDEGIELKDFNGMPKPAPVVCYLFTFSFSLSPLSFSLTMFFRIRNIISKISEIE